MYDVYSGLGFRILVYMMTYDVYSGLGFRVLVYAAGTYTAAICYMMVYNASHMHWVVIRICESEIIQCYIIYQIHDTYVDVYTHDDVSCITCITATCSSVANIIYNV